ncbi:hypothetical protein GCM10017083_29490 [Thalassobaculum fulvum]|uniref:Uncharacterized protein n=1 Tax=Thalassobaculum fulvum TaxID=1633335 RepID=A0A918XTX9_9PROT|nr:hypothetical protein [Thalassobaculum fulvum]GHD53142.1 hypothetical protein GCM10017083_29490 [Thalassobaculum fulvum]
MSGDGDLAAVLRGFLHARGPSLGVDLVSHTGENVLTLARVLGTDPAVGRRALRTSYLRIDADSPGCARISPSFLRKFISFTLFGLEGAAQDGAALDAAFAALVDKHRTISRRKRELAQDLVRELHDLCAAELTGDFAVLICGDVVYDLAHDARRREHSTGIPVRGSDIDLVILLDEPDLHLKDRLETELLKHKYFWLRHPTIQEELDFIIKTPGDVRRQAGLETVKDKIAVKVMMESRVLFEAGDIARRCAAIVQDPGVRGWFDEAEREARTRHEQLEADVYAGLVTDLSAEDRSIFFSAELDELGEFCESRHALTALKP